jgi:signal transduction histidine kinase
VSTGELDFKSLFEDAPGLFLVLLPDAPRFTIVGATNAYLRATLTERRSVLGRAMFDTFPDNPADPAATGVRNLSNSLHRVVQSRMPDTMAVQKYDIRSAGSDGGFIERWWSPVNSPVLGPDGQLRYIIHRVEDVTEFVQLQRRERALTAEYSGRIQQAEAEIFERTRELDAANELLRQHNRSKDIFVAMVGHELRNPLTSLKASLHLLRRMAAGVPSATEAFNLVERQAAAIARLAEDLVDAGRARNGELELRRDRIDLSELAEATVSSYQRLGRLDQHQPIIRTASAVVLADRRRMEQVLLNLLDNAVKYTPAGKRIEVTVRCDGDEAVLAVQDDGMGMRDEDLARAFDWFFQANQSLDRAQGGFGIGLALVRKFVELNGGRVSARGAPGEGTVVEVRLPLDRGTVSPPRH